MDEPIAIVGGGLAGLTLGIGLRRQGVPVTIWEAGSYPRHRVCGEFMCGRGLDSLERLGLLDSMREAGASSATSAAFFAGKRTIPERPLPQVALCLSRYRLDEWLAGEFQRLGGQLRSGARWRGEYGPGMVCASGRRIEPVAQGWRWFGLKAHAAGIVLTADLELHFVPSGYVGLCRLPDGRVNVCGLFRSESTVPGLAREWRDWLAGPPDSILHSRLAGAAWDDSSFCSVAGFSPRPKRADQTQCRLGDALTMIPPLTGNGMSMAFESAELAIEPLVQFSRRKLDWSQTCREIARACDTRFARRLLWADGLQRALFFSPTRAVLLLAVTRSKSVWRVAFGLTR